MTVSTKNFSNIDQLIHQRIVIDTSVVLKIFFTEEGSEMVKKIVKLHKSMQLTLLATPLIFFEFLNVISKRLKNKEAAETTLKKFLKIKIAVIDAKYGYLEKGIQIACENSQVAYYDSSYHALAKDLDGIFLTADQKYYQAAKGEGNIVLLTDLAK